MISYDNTTIPTRIPALGEQTLRQNLPLRCPSGKLTDGNERDMKDPSSYAQKTIAGIFTSSKPYGKPSLRGRPTSGPGFFMRLLLVLGLLMVSVKGAGAPTPTQRMQKKDLGGRALAQEGLQEVQGRILIERSVDGMSSLFNTICKGTDSATSVMTNGDT
ncbi:hypothetical protein TrCOL_g3883, partial [Triparma columacea]